MVGSIHFGAITRDQIQPGVGLESNNGRTFYPKAGPDGGLITKKTWWGWGNGLKVKGEGTMNNGKDRYSWQTFRFDNYKDHSQPVDYDWFEKTPGYYLSADA